MSCLGIVKCGILATVIANDMAVHTLDDPDTAHLDKYEIDASYMHKHFVAKCIL